MKRIDRFGLLASLLARKQASHGADFEAEREKFHAQLEKFAEPLSFANVLMLAFALSVLFHGKRRSFVEHGVISLTFLSFVLFSSLLFAVMPALMRMGYRAILMPVIVATLVWQFSYLAVAIRRFYFAADQRRLAPALWATGAAFVIYFLNSAFITAVQILGTALALLGL